VKYLFLVLINESKTTRTNGIARYILAYGKKIEVVPLYTLETNNDKRIRTDNDAETKASICIFRLKK